ncbi:hypothetical protein [Pseudomonas asplenii]|uniref:hypothetical protein n=1 Tax=Pseudomonas asplenii TaxID=53407 RepID=UPI0022347E56|nr:hypothetical protein [Pseudomonas asplenii]UZE31850.1 hypothetical protein LOY63_00775 [Pseudomonas asplenii]
MLLVVLGGCGQVSNIRSFSTAYTSPQAGETARLRVVSDGMVRAVPGRNCLDWTSPGVMVSAQSGFTDRNGERLGMPGMAPRSVGAVSSELVIPANKPIAFHYLAQQRYARQCFNTLSFVPRPGVDYQLQATMAGGCRVELDERRAGEEWLQIVDATQTAKASMCKVMDNF